MLTWRTVRGQRHLTFDLRPVCGIEGGCTDEDAPVCTDCRAAVHAAIETMWP